MPQISVKAVGANLVGKKLRQFAEDLPEIPMPAFYGRMMAAKKRITHYPPLWKGTLPKNWYKSERQRRYVMMLVKEGRIPYQRTGRYMDVWKLKRIPRGYQMFTSGPADAYAKYVGGNAYGKEQAKIHQGRWAVAAEVIEEELLKLPPEVNKYLTTAIHQRGLG